MMPEEIQLPFLAPGETPTDTPSPTQIDRYRRARAALGGLDPRAAYWLGGGWYVTADPQAVPGDPAWQTWIPA